ncbi:MAG: ABC transporter ATP-binding protein [Acidobacteria bacterium]|nr:MAG: ABC transporter ATP-binding protein [Acidobacteriota bacterium]
MSDWAVSINHLSKSYLVADRTRSTSLAEALSRMFRNGIRKRAGREFWAVRDVSLEIKRGEILGIIGRNGAGKTTLLKVLSRITEPTSGQIDLYGRVGSLLEVGTGFHPELTGRENIYLNGAILGMSRKEVDTKFDSIVAFAETEAFLDTPVKRYSSGMYVRLAFAVAAHLEPDILMIDEVLAVGDIQFQRKSIARMESAASTEGKTILFVSHNLAAVAKLCTRVALLDQGKLLSVGSPSAVIAEYLSLASEEKRAVAVLESPDLTHPLTRVAVTTLNSRSECIGHFRFGEPWRIRLQFDISDRVDHCIAAVGLQTIDAIPITTFWSQPADLEAGSYCAEFPCDLCLSAGEIMIVVGISSFERSVFYRERFNQVSISELAEGEQPHRVSGAGLITATVRPQITLADSR